MFNKKEKQPKKPKEPKIKVQKVGKKKYSLIVMWIVLIGSVGFGVYNNYRAIDTHTVHETERIVEKVDDTNAVENYVKNFASAYFSWEPTTKSIEERSERVDQMLSEDLQNMQEDVVRSDIPNSSTVNETQIINVEKINDNEYKVSYTVFLRLEFDEEKSWVNESYTIKVYRNEDMNMVVTQLPTLYTRPARAKYQPKRLEADGSVDSTSILEITEFLETFFKMYPSATDKELAYYTKEGVLKVINKEYIYSQLLSTVCVADKDNVRVQVSVEYLNPTTNMANISQYDLVLQKGDTWLIVESN